MIYIPSPWDFGLSKIPASEFRPEELYRAYLVLNAKRYFESTVSLTA